MPENEINNDDQLKDHHFIERKLGILEALLFAADEPLNEKTIAEISKEILEAEISELAEKLDAKYENNGHGIMVQYIAGGWRLTTRANYAEIVKRLLRGSIRSRLTRASLETVSIVAYRQPITRAEIEAIRGVDPSPVLRNLLERNLVRITGRADVPRRPLLYGTTDAFLTYFGLNDLHSLPKPEEILGAIEEKGKEVEKEGPFNATVSD
ncbi:MAG: SMC-Scp complex subunit ScpB [Candidatus Electryonea clarkiae]|nr:SMC-Scp complex subunit ScpB [Candidatus Electryonea clarkiae]MDP8287472.1 SMC-Scp complex subunit ScpB [Candidatus Electryonea clarkiae]